MQTCSIGLTNPKSAQNMGSILRSGGCFGIQSIMYTGQRINYAMAMRTDTRNARAKIPMFGCCDLFETAPKNATKVAVELVTGATPLPAFEHPKNGFYLFGPEDGSLTQYQVKQCDEVVYIPSLGSLNLAMAVTVMLYDRASKFSSNNQESLWQYRDNNNNLRLT